MTAPFGDLKVQSRRSQLLEIIKASVRPRRRKYNFSVRPATDSALTAGGVYLSGLVHHSCMGPVSYPRHARTTQRQELAKPAIEPGTSAGKAAALLFTLRVWHAPTNCPAAHRPAPELAIAEAISRVSPADVKTRFRSELVFPQGQSAVVPICAIAKETAVASICRVINIRGIDVNVLRGAHPDDVDATAQCH